MRIDRELLHRIVNGSIDYAHVPLKALAHLRAPAGLVHFYPSVPVGNGLLLLLVTIFQPRKAGNNATDLRTAAEREATDAYSGRHGYHQNNDANQPGQLRKRNLPAAVHNPKE